VRFTGSARWSKLGGTLKRILPAGALARTARRVAAASIYVPVVVIVDDADCLDARLAVTLVTASLGLRLRLPARSAAG
jgi:hypothetical protein